MFKRLYLEKFPVVSPSCKEYRVTVYEDSLGLLRVNLYVPTNRKWFKWKNVSEGCYLKSREDSYIDITIKEVLKYEKRFEKEETYKESLREFEAWDGVIKEV